MIPLSVGVIGIVTAKNYVLYPTPSSPKHVCRGNRTLSLEDYFKRILDGDFTKSKSVPKHEDIRGSVSSD